MAALNQRGIPFCIRVEKSGNSGFACVREFLRSGLVEHVSGLSQLAVVQDVAAKVLCDNLQALTALSARDAADLP